MGQDWFVARRATELSGAQTRSAGVAAARFALCGNWLA